MNKLKYLRLLKGLTIRDVGAKTNINRSTISELERGKISLTEKYIKVFCAFYNVTSDYLLGLSLVNLKEHDDFKVLMAYRPTKVEVKNAKKTLLNYLFFKMLEEKEND